MNTYRLKRTVVEEYEILANSKQDARDIIESEGVIDPIKITVKREVITLDTAI